MNSVQLIGRLTKDPEVRYTDSNVAIARFSLAINRGKSNDKENNVDYINILALGKTAENIERYLKKGSQTGINGRIQTGSYTNKDGMKVYTTEVVVEKIKFLDNKINSIKDNSLGEYTELLDEEIPF